MDRTKRRCALCFAFVNLDAQHPPFAIISFKSTVPPRYFCSFEHLKGYSNLDITQRQKRGVELSKINYLTTQNKSGRWCFGPRTMNSLGKSGAVG